MGAERTAEVARPFLLSSVFCLLYPYWQGDPARCFLYLPPDRAFLAPRVPVYETGTSLWPRTTPLTAASF